MPQQMEVVLDYVPVVAGTVYLSKNLRGDAPE